MSTAVVVHLITFHQAVLIVLDFRLSQGSH